MLDFCGSGSGFVILAVRRARPLGDRPPDVIELFGGLHSTHWLRSPAGPFERRQLPTPPAAHRRKASEARLPWPITTSETGSTFTSETRTIDIFTIPMSAPSPTHCLAVNWVSCWVHTGYLKYTDSPWHPGSFQVHEIKDQGFTPDDFWV